MIRRNSKFGIIKALLQENRSAFYHLRNISSTAPATVNTAPTM